MESRRDSPDRSASSSSTEKGLGALAAGSSQQSAGQASAPVDHRFPKSARVKDPARFKAAFNSAHVAVDQRLVVSLLASQSRSAKLGISIPKKTGNAPVRNRWKRLIREAFRLQRNQLPEGWDIFVRPRKGAQPDAGMISVSLLRLAHRASHASNSGRK